MLNKLLTISLLACATVAQAGQVPDVQALEIFGGGKDGKGAVLVGPDASQQLVVTATHVEGQTDFTSGVKYAADPEGIVEISATGEVTPIADGTVTISASSGAITGQAMLSVTQHDTPLAINFPNEVVPLFTKFGCNGGGCHGKSEGQNAFKLSLLGFEPIEDYEYLAKEARGRRISPGAPDHSLLLLKGAGILPHGGGTRLKKGSPEYQTVVRWIEQGMPYGEKDDPVVERIEVFPKSRIMGPGGTQQLAVTAFYTDGATRDITRTVGYEANQKEMAEASETGLVTVADTTGDIAVMIRFGELVDVFQATIPLGAKVENLPPARNFIDEIVYTKLKTLGLPPSDPCDDATFLRRTSIDIAGRLPEPEEAEKFLADKDPNKRAKRVETLLASTEYAEYFANKWASILRNKRSNGNFAHGTHAFYEWIRESLHENKPYDQFVGQIVAATGEIGQNPAVAWYRNVKKREEQLQDVAQVFLGVRLQCAQCHHHPYEKWSQDDYYGFAAFFSQVGRKKGVRPDEEVIFHKRGIANAQNPKNKANLPPKPLGGVSVKPTKARDPRKDLAQWMGSKDNPFLAHMLVNRYWKHFFGTGLVEPEDDIRVTNPATNPILLNALANNFIESDFDLKQLVRTITNSQIYQLSSMPNEHNEGDKQNYSRYYPKRLTAEVLLDAIDGLTGVSTKFPGLPVGTRAVELPDDSFNKSSYFLTVFGRPEMDSACECERTQDANLAQSLHLLNSKGIQDKLTSGAGRAAKLSGDEKRAYGERIRELYLRAFSREPKSEEIEIATGYIEKKIDKKITYEVEVAKKDDKGKETKVNETKERTADEKKKEAFEDVIWALMNTKEFLFNH